MSCNNLTLREVEKHEEIKARDSRRKEIAKRAKINEIETRKTMEKTDKTEVLVFLKIKNWQNFTKAMWESKRRFI